MNEYEYIYDFEQLLFFPNFYDFHLSLRIIKQPIQNYIHSLNQVLCLHEHLSMPRLRITIFKKICICIFNILHYFFKIPTLYVLVTPNFPISFFDSVAVRAGPVMCCV